MKRYLALLRGVNVGGKNRISMAELKSILESLGFGEVRTCLNSGNAAFTAEETDEAALGMVIADALRTRMGLELPAVVLPQDALSELLQRAPDWWGTDDKGIYDNLILALPPMTGSEIAEKLGAPSEGLEQFCVCGRAIFWSFDRKRYARCSWWKKSASPGIGEWITIRTANTMKKLAAL